MNIVRGDIIHSDNVPTGLSRGNSLLAYSTDPEVAGGITEAGIFTTA